jgi:outer membrane protein
MNRKILVLWIALGLVLSKDLWAQGSAPLKYAVLNVVRAIAESSEGKQANEDYQIKLEAKRDELAKKQKEIQDLQQQLQSQAKTLNDEARYALTKSINTKNTELQRAQEDAEKEFAAMRNGIFNRIGSKLAPVVQQYAKEYNFALILDSSSQASPIVYSDAAVEITDDIVKRFDASQVSSRGPGLPNEKTAATPPNAPAATANTK